MYRQMREKTPENLSAVLGTSVLYLKELSEGGNTRWLFQSKYRKSLPSLMDLKVEPRRARLNMRPSLPTLNRQVLSVYRVGWFHLTNDKNRVTGWRRRSWQCYI